MPPLQKIGLEAILRMTNFSKGLKAYTKGVGKMEKTTKAGAKNLKGLDKQFGSLKGGLFNVLPGMAAVTGAAFALKQAFEFGKEGAVIAQTRASFDGLMTSMGVAPGVLKEMSAATLETVDDQTLMASTMTLLAGTSDKLGSAIVGNASKLLEIAKAANKLNPALGSTAFLYESLAAGIKRSSPLVLDNLGLTIKVGDANQAWADKMDIAVEAMSAEQKQMALLDAALESGDRMIQQVGGSVEAMGDEFAQAEVKIKNATDQLKAQTVPVWAEILGFLADMITPMEETIEKFDEIREGSGAYLEYLDAVLKVAQATHLLSEEEVLLIKRQAALGEEFHSSLEGLGIYTEAQYDALEAARLTEHEQWRLSGTTAKLAVVTEDLAEAEETAEEEARRLEKAQKDLEKQIQETRDATERYYGTLTKGIISLRDMDKAHTQSAETYKKSMEDIRREAGKAYTEVKENFEASLPDPTSVADRMEMTGDAWDEWALRIQAIIEGGVESPWYAALQEMGYSKPPDVGMNEWLEDLKTKFYAGQLPDLLPPEWAAKVKEQQEEATRVVQAENAKRLAAAKAAREEELAAEQEARNRATIELALTLAEQNQQLQAWSEQTFGPNFSQVADSAEEVMALLESGRLEMDKALQGIIEGNVAQVQAVLNSTGELAEETQKQLSDIATTDQLPTIRAAITEALGPEALPIEEFAQRAQEMFEDFEDGVPITPFLPIKDDWDVQSGEIVNQAVTMGLELDTTFGTIDKDWGATVNTMVKDWEDGMKKVQKAIQEKVIEKLEQIPENITVQIEITQAEGEGGEGKQHGGPVTAGRPYTVGEAGPELFVPDQPGTIIPNWALNLPAGAGGAAGGVMGTGVQVNLTMNPVINTPMDAAEFQAMTLRTVQRAIREA